MATATTTRREADGPAGTTQSAAASRCWFEEGQRVRERVPSARPVAWTGEQTGAMHAYPGAPGSRPDPTHLGRANTQNSLLLRSCPTSNTRGILDSYLLDSNKCRRDKIAWHLISADDTDRNIGLIDQLDDSAC